MGPKELGAALLVLVTAFVAWSVLWPAGETTERAALRLEAGSEVPAIGLDRLAKLGTKASQPARDVFKFGRDARADLSPVKAPVIALAPTPETTPFPVEPTPTPWPTLNISLIGIVDNGAGQKVASFVKDDTVLVGRPGQVVGNSFRVIRIGTESAEIQELGSGRTRRLPLRTN